MKKVRQAWNTMQRQQIIICPKFQPRLKCKPFCFLGKQPHWACCFFSPGWNSISITWPSWRFFSLFAQAGNPSPLSESRLGFSSLAEIQLTGWNPLHVIATFISEPRLKSQTTLKFGMVTGQCDWSPIQSVIIKAIYKIGWPWSGSLICYSKVWLQSEMDDTYMIALEIFYLTSISLRGGGKFTLTGT